MSTSAPKKRFKAAWSIAAAVVVVMAGLAYSAISLLLKDDGPKHRRQVQMVTLVKPPPPVIKEKPPEPEVQKKEEIVEPEQAPPPEDNNQAQDEPPPGQDLGVDAEGSGSGDGFGLVGRKGGQSLIGSGGDRSLMQRYAWYTRMIQEEIRKKMDAHMAKNGGLPDGDYKAMLKIVLDGGGRIVDFQLFGSSGNSRIDEALKATLASVRIDEAPPEGMPRSIRLKVSSKG